MGKRCIHRVISHAASYHFLWRCVRFVSRPSAGAFSFYHLLLCICCVLSISHGLLSSWGGTRGQAPQQNKIQSRRSIRPSTLVQKAAETRASSLFLAENIKKNWKPSLSAVKNLPDWLRRLRLYILTERCALCIFFYFLSQITIMHLLLSCLLIGFKCAL